VVLWAFSVVEVSSLFQDYAKENALAFYSASSLSHELSAETHEVPAV
jgi:hypothetical protein